MKIAAIIITMDRSPRHNYLSDSLRHMIAAGITYDDRFTLDIFHDGSSKANLDPELVRDSNATLYFNENPCHFNIAVATALEKASSRNADHVLFFEDDVMVCKDFPEFVCSQLSLAPDAPLFDFVTYYNEVTDAYHHGKRIIELNAQQFYGTQCFAMPTGQARAYSRYILANHPQKDGFADRWFDDWLVENNLPNYVISSVPSAAQHIGADSNHDHEFILAPAFKDDLDAHIPIMTNKFERVSASQDEYVLQSVSLGTVLQLNLSAQIIYLFCDGEMTISDIENELVANTQADRYDTNQHIRQCLATLIQHKAVVYAPAHSDSAG